MASILSRPQCVNIISADGQVNTLGPTQNGSHFADGIFKCISISIKISLKFVPKGPINNIPALLQIMAWRRPGDKPLSEAMMVNLPTYIGVTQPQWVNINSFWPSDAIWWHRSTGQPWLMWWLGAWWHQVITWSSVNLSWHVFWGIQLRAISQKVLKIGIHKTSLKITLLKS